MDSVISKLLPMDAATRYVAQVLAVGGATEGAAIAQRLATASLYALVPSEVDGDSLLNFERGGVLAAMPAIPDGNVLVQRVPTTIPTAAAIVSDAMAVLDQAVFLVHEPMLSGDELARKSIPYILVSGQPYRFSTIDSDEKALAESIRFGHLSWHFLGFVVERRREFNSVDELVESAKLMLVGAYDGESFLYSLRA